MFDSKETEGRRRKTDDVAGCFYDGRMGSEPERYVCSACGNRTRFDVVESLRRRRYQHYTLGGEMTVDEESVLERVVESVTCRWCDRTDSVETLPQT